MKLGKLDLSLGFWIISSVIESSEFQTTWYCYVDFMNNTICAVTEFPIRARGTFFMSFKYIVDCFKCICDNFIIYILAIAMCDSEGYSDI